MIAILRWAAANDVAAARQAWKAPGCAACCASPVGEVRLLHGAGAFDRIFDLDETNLTCRGESGVHGFALEKRFNERGLTLGHFPSSLPGTTIGGLIATRSSGQESSRYGNVEDMVLGLAVVLPRDVRHASSRPTVSRRAGAASAFVGPKARWGSS